MDKVHPRGFTDFLKYRGTNFEKYLLPIIPAGATLGADSKLDAGDLGKIPGWMKPDDTWVGLHDWPTYYQWLRRGALERFMGWQLSRGIFIPAGINGIVHIGLDADTDDPEITDWFRQRGEYHFGKTPMVRRRDGSIRFVLAYRRDEHSAPFGKLFFVGVRKGEDPRDPNVQKHRFEILANGTHWVMEGPHAKGAMHYWENEINPVEVYNEIPLVTKSNAFALHADLLQNCGDAGLEFIALGGMRTAANRAPAVKIEDPKSPLLAKDLGLLARAIKAIDINDPKLADYDTWCTLFRAMWAACGGDRAFYADHILPWLDGNPQNLEDDMEAKLASFRDSQVGAEHIYWWAAHCGHPEFYEEYRGEYAKAMFDALPVDTSQAGGADGSAGGSSGIGIGAAGGSGLRRNWLSRSNPAGRQSRRDR